MTTELLPLSGPSGEAEVGEADSKREKNPGLGKLQNQPHEIHIFFLQLTDPGQLG